MLAHYGIAYFVGAVLEAAPSRREARDERARVRVAAGAAAARVEEGAREDRRAGLLVRGGRSGRLRLREPVPRARPPESRCAPRHPARAARTRRPILWCALRRLGACSQVEPAFAR